MVNLFSSAALAELKSAMSLSEADMADYRVQRTGEDGLNGKEPNSNNISKLQNLACTVHLLHPS